MKVVAFVFARGGSKGLPGKNIRSLNGKPLLQYSIETAKKIDGIDDVFVSTDCEAIAKVAEQFGAKIIKRPAELSTDTSPEWLSWQHAIHYVESNFGEFDSFVSLPATSPLRNEFDVKSAIDKLHNANADACISITPASRSPYFNMVSINADGTVGLVNKSLDVVSRRQDAPVVYDITTVVYAVSVEYIKKGTSLFLGEVVATVVPKERAVDIDDIYDFLLAEAIVNEWGDNDS